MEKYEKIKILGRGAHGIVHLSRRLFDNKLVVIKEIQTETKTFDERQAALQEVKLLALLHHPNVIGFYGNFFDDQNNALCIAMEYAEGGTLADLISQRNGSPMSENQIVKIFAQLCNSLFYLHGKNVLHRDIKPQNILLDRTKSLCKLSDFGISRLLSTITKASTVIGTPSYLSPEICEGKPYNKKSDVWSLGCILYELVTLRKAFGAETLGSLVLQITKGHIKPIDDQYSKNLNDLVSRILNVDPESRPSVQEIRADIVVAPFLFDHIDIGGIRCPRLLNPSRTIKLRSSNRSRKHLNVNPDGTPPKLRQIYKVFAWGAAFGNKITQLPLPASKCIIRLALSYDQKMAITKDNELLVWQRNKEDCMKSWQWQIMKFSTQVQIVQVACTEMFYAVITDRGILMTCGGGVDGSLQHGTNPVFKPRIVDTLVRSEVIKIACSKYHVLASTSDDELFGWGTLDGGRLGLPGSGRLNRAQKITLPENMIIHSIYCTLDSSAVLSMEGELYCTGNNNCNKLALYNNEIDGTSLQQTYSFQKSCIGPRTISTDARLPFSFSANHSAFISGGLLYTVGSSRNNELGPRSLDCEDNVPSLVETKNLTSLLSVVCGDGYTVIQTEDNRVYSFGLTEKFKLGRVGNGKEVGIVSIDNLAYESIMSICTDGESTVALVRY